jgi:hypothetical protein
LAVGDILLVGLNTGEEVFEGGCAGSIVGIDGLLSLGRNSRSLRAVSKQGVGDVVTSNASSGLRKRRAIKNSVSSCP